MIGWIEAVNRGDSRWGNLVLYDDCLVLAAGDQEPARSIEGDALEALRALGYEQEKLDAAALTAKNPSNLRIAYADIKSAKATGRRVALRLVDGKRHKLTFRDRPSTNPDGLLPKALGDKLTSTAGRSSAPVSFAAWATMLGVPFVFIGVVLLIAGLPTTTTTHPAKLTDAYQARRYSNGTYYYEKVVALDVEGEGSHTVSNDGVYDVAKRSQLPLDVTVKVRAHDVKQVIIGGHTYGTSLSRTGQLIGAAITLSLGVALLVGPRVARRRRAAA